MKYKTIVIDPPWKLQASLKKMVGKNGYHTNLPYKTMTDEEITQFPINDFAEKDSDLFMWVTHSKLPAVLEIVKKWGFKYHVLIAWDKAGGVCMNGFYRRTEFIIYAYRGKLGVNVGEGSYLPTLFRQVKTKHSEKPRIFYDLLRGRTREPRIDIFARKRHIGFDAYGDQVEKASDTQLITEGEVV